LHDFETFLEVVFFSLKTAQEGMELLGLLGQLGVVSAVDLEGLQSLLQDRFLLSLQLLLRLSCLSFTFGYFPTAPFL